MAPTKLEAIEITGHLVKTGKLEAHPDFIKASMGYLLDHCNGCGAAGAKFDFVPDTIYGLNIIFACIIHDFDYARGKTAEDKRAADIRFLVNLTLLILDGSNSFMKVPRVMRAVKYFLAVELKGDDAFYEGKK